MSKVLLGGGLIEPVRYFFDQDDSSHWYMVPEELQEEWMEWSDTTYEDQMGEERFESLTDKFDQYRLGGGINHIMFERPEEC